MRITILTLFLLLTGFTSRAQLQPIDVTKTDSVMRVQPKPILALITAPWCKYCLMQKTQLQRNREFTARSGGFYYVEFDAESIRLPITFNGQIYNYHSSGSNTGVHQLAEALNGSARLSYPTWVILNQHYEVLGRYSGLLDARQISTVLSALATRQGESNSLMKIN